MHSKFYPALIFLTPQTISSGAKNSSRNKSALETFDGIFHLDTSASNLLCLVTFYIGPADDLVLSRADLRPCSGALTRLVDTVGLAFIGLCHRY